MYRMRDLENAGARISFGSDWPVSSPTPLLGIATAVNRSLPGGESWIKEQALTVREALNAYTSGVTAQLAKPELSGTLETGQPAEFVVLSGNPFDLHDREIFELNVVATNSLGNPFTKLH
jgi:predicted amidohydrolase YtcJ